MVLILKAFQSTQAQLEAAWVPPRHVNELATPATAVYQPAEPFLQPVIERGLRQIVEQKCSYSLSFELSPGGLG